MKKLFLSFVVFSVLLLIGCQENSITDPAVDKTLNKDQVPGRTNLTGTIPLEGQLQDPSDPSNYLTINGIIEYEHDLVPIDPIPPAPQYYVSVNLTTQATISDDDQPIETEVVVNGTSQDEFYVSEEGVYVLERYYEVTGMTDGMVLFCRFLVTTDGIGLNSMWLEVFQN
jgi:hypothetical protein